MNLLQKSPVLDNIEDQLLRMAFNSFNKEKQLYDNSNVKIETINDLTPAKCKEIFDSILNINSDIFEPLRDEKFYYGITVRIKNTLTRQDINVLHSKNNSELFKTRFMQTLEDKLQNNIKEEEIGEIFINTFLDQIGFDNKNKTIDVSKIESSKIASIDNSKKQIIITLTGKNSTDNKVIDFINDENGIKIKSFQWNKQDTFNFITTIKTVSGKKILSSGNLRLQGLEDVDVYKPADKIYNVFINYFEAYPELKEYLEKKKDNIINTLTNNNTVKDLLLGDKTINDVKGDIGEFLVGIMLDAALINNNENKNIYQGKMQTGFGQHPVDVYIKDMGFQVKNFPGQEKKDIVMLYASHSSLSKADRLQESDKYLSKEEKKQLRYNVISSNNTEINNLLLSSLSKFMRIDSNYKETEQVTKEILKQARSMENCFYIVNFRLIPASRLLWEMAQNITEYRKFQYNYEIQYMFCIDKNETEYKQLPLNKFYDKNKVNIFEDAALYFRGIPLKYNNIKLKIEKGNFLSDIFEVGFYNY